MVVCMSILGMELDLSKPHPMMLLTKDIVGNSIAPLLSLQTMGHLRRTSRGCRELFNIVRVCPSFYRPASYNITCSAQACSVLAHNYYACTKALAHYADEKTFNHCADEGIQDKEKFRKMMFDHWWGYHATVRDKSLVALLGHYNITVDNRMKGYRKYYSTATMIKKRMFEDVQEALKQEELSMAKTLLVGSNLNVFDLVKESYFFNNAWSRVTTMLWCACYLYDSSLVHALCGGKAIDNELVEHVVAYSASRLIQELIQAGALSVDTVDTWTKKTVLHYAAEHNKYEVISFLLARGAYVNCLDAKKRAPLHYAVQRRHVGAVRELLKCPDADVRFTDKYGNTVMRYASSCGWESDNERDNRYAIKRLLKKHVAKPSDPHSRPKLSGKGYHEL